MGVYWPNGLEDVFFKRVFYLKEVKCGGRSVSNASHRNVFTAEVKRSPGFLRLRSPGTGGTLGEITRLENKQRMIYRVIAYS